MIKGPYIGRIDFKLEFIVMHSSDQKECMLKLAILDHLYRWTIYRFSYASTCSALVVKTSLADNLQLAFEYKRFHVAIKFDGLKSSRLIAESSAYRMDRCSISHSFCFVAGLFKYRIQSIYYWPSEILDKSKNAYTKLCPIKFNPFKYLQQAKFVT